MVRRHWRSVQCHTGSYAYVHRTTGAMHVSIATSVAMVGWPVLQGGWRREHPPRRPPPSLSSDTESVRRAAADSAPPPAQAAFRRRQSWQTS